MFDAMGEMRRKTNRDGGGTYMTFTKNRNGNVGKIFNYTLSNDQIVYGAIEEEEVE